MFDKCKTDLGNRERERERKCVHVCVYVCESGFDANVRVRTMCAPLSVYVSASMSARVYVLTHVRAVPDFDHRTNGADAPIFMGLCAGVFVLALAISRRAQTLGGGCQMMNTLTLQHTRTQAETRFAQPNAHRYRHAHDQKFTCTPCTRFTFKGIPPKSTFRAMSILMVFVG